MKKSYLVGGGLIAALVLVMVANAFFHAHPVAVLDPHGVIAAQQRNILITATLLMLFVVVPVFVLTGMIVWRYREKNTKAKRQPDWDHNPWLEITWWAIPCIIIGILAVLTWHVSHTLDPFRSLVSDKQPLTVQVVALDWKWLFIYPQQGVATVNYVEFPVGTPVDFQITSDAPMNSFWIPALAGQIYAMPGMSTGLHLMATTAGDYRGVSANISGSGFAGMHFTAQAVSSAAFNDWLKQTHTNPSLTYDTYQKLARPSENNPRATYGSVADNLYDTILLKYMVPTSQSAATNQGEVAQ